MATHRPARVGAAAAAVLGILALAGPARGQPSGAPPAQGAYAGFVPLLGRDEPAPSFWGEAGPPPPGDDDEPARQSADGETPGPGEREATAGGEGADHAHH